MKKIKIMATMLIGLSLTSHAFADRPKPPLPPNCEGSCTQRAATAQDAINLGIITTPIPSFVFGYACSNEGAVCETDNHIGNCQTNATDVLIPGYGYKIEMNCGCVTGEGPTSN